MSSSYSTTSHSGFIIQSSFTPSEFFTNYHLLLLRAKDLSIHDYVIGEKKLPTRAEIEVLHYSQLHYFQIQLAIKTKAQEAKLKLALLSEIESNHLHAYKYLVPIVAVDPLHPTFDELTNSRLRIPYNDYAYTRYLKSINEKVIQINVNRRTRQYNATRPSVSYYGYGSPNDQDVIDAENVPFIQKSDWPLLVDAEVAIHPSIIRLEADDTVQTISVKLDREGCTIAASEYNSAHKDYEKEYARVEALHSKMKIFFYDAIEGISASTANTYIISQEWHLVLPSLADNYGNVLSAASLNEMQVKFSSIVLGPQETVHVFLNKIKEYAANIHIISEKVEEVVHKLTYPEAYETCLITDELFAVKFPRNKRYTAHLTILNCMIVAVTGSRLERAVYDFNTKVKGVANRTVDRLIEELIIGETALEPNQQVRHEISSVTTSTSQPTKGVKFCAYHSYDGNESYHSTNDCKLINNGKTKQDPANTKWQVWKETGLHYTPLHSGGSKSSGGAISGNKRALTPSNSTSSNKEPKSSPAPIGKSCTTCLKHNREGAAIPETIMKKHAAATCRVNPANYPPAATGSTQSTSSASSSNGELSKIYKAINSLSSSIATITTAGKKKSTHGKSSRVTELPSDTEDA